MWVYQMAMFDHHNWIWHHPCHLEGTAGPAWVTCSKRNGLKAWLTRGVQCVTKQVGESFRNPGSFLGSNSVFEWIILLVLTPPKFNMEPENDGFQKESPFPGADFQVPLHAPIFLEDCKGQLWCVNLVDCCVVTKWSPQATSKCLALFIGLYSANHHRTMNRYDKDTDFNGCIGTWTPSSLITIGKRLLLLIFMLKLPNANICIYNHNIDR